MELAEEARLERDAALSAADGRWVIQSSALVAADGWYVALWGWWLHRDAANKSMNPNNQPTINRQGPRGGRPRGALGGGD